MLCYFTTSHRDSDILSRYVLFCFHCNIKLLLVFLIAKVYTKHTPVVQLSLTSELQKHLLGLRIGLLFLAIYLQKALTKLNSRHLQGFAVGQSSLATRSSSKSLPAARNTYLLSSPRARRSKQVNLQDGIVDVLEWQSDSLNQTDYHDECYTTITCWIKDIQQQKCTLNNTLAATHLCQVGLIYM